MRRRRNFAFCTFWTSFSSISFGLHYQCQFFNQKGPSTCRDDSKKVLFISICAVVRPWCEDKAIFAFVLYIYRERCTNATHHAKVTLGTFFPKCLRSSHHCTSMFSCNRPNQWIHYFPPSVGRIISLPTLPTNGGGGGSLNTGAGLGHGVFKALNFKKIAAPLQVILFVFLKLCTWMYTMSRKSKNSFSQAIIN